MNSTPRATDDEGLSDVASLIHGDARTELTSIADNTFDAVITDPPYGMDFTRNDRAGRNWDRSRIAFDTEFWAEVKRVAKPGATLLAFGHSRTFARMSVAIEDAGFSILDTLASINGQGYAAGFRDLEEGLTRAGSDRASDFQGWGNVLRPAFEPIVLARNLSPADSVTHTIINGGSGGLNIDATRIPAIDADRGRTPGRRNEANHWRIQRTGEARSVPNPGGRMPSNVLLQHGTLCIPGGVCQSDCPAEIIRLQALASRGRNQDARRFYQGFYHHPKAPLSERTSVDGVTGPTVKAQGVMDWLVALAVRPGELVLDPFAGTGSTLLACAKAGVRSVGIEIEDAYVPIIRERFRALTNA
jgi:site-specific DNA-methyltransferase (adenine-specific)